MSGASTELSSCGCRVVAERLGVADGLEGVSVVRDDGSEVPANGDDVEPSVQAGAGVSGEVESSCTGELVLLGSRHRVLWADVVPSGGAPDFNEDEVRGVLSDEVDLSDAEVDVAIEDAPSKSNEGVLGNAFGFIAALFCVLHDALQSEGMLWSRRGSAVVACLVPKDCRLAGFDGLDDVVRDAESGAIRCGSTGGSRGAVRVGVFECEVAGLGAEVAFTEVSRADAGAALRVVGEDAGRGGGCVCRFVVIAERSELGGVGHRAGLPEVVAACEERDSEEEPCETSKHVEIRRQGRGGESVPRARGEVNEDGRVG